MMLDGMTSGSIPTAITRADAPRLLGYTWQLDQLGRSVLRWELEPIPSGARLTLPQTVRDADWIPKIAAGWHLCLLVAERLLQGYPINPIIGEAAYAFGWRALHDAYAAQLQTPGHASEVIWIVTRDRSGQS